MSTNTQVHSHGFRLSKLSLIYVLRWQMTRRQRRRLSSIRRSFLGFVLIISASLMVTGLAHTTTAETIFLDKFEDGSATDGSPVTWEVVNSSCWPQTSFNVADGDLRVTSAEGDKAAVVGVSTTPLGDSSIRARVRVESDWAEHGAAVYLRGNRDTCLGHALEITIDGSLWLGIAGEFEQFPTDLQPGMYDVMLQLDAIGDTITARAWRAGEPMPEEPTLTRTSDELTMGLPGVYYAPSLSQSGTAGTAVFRHVHVADSVIVPEPSSLALCACGVFGLGLFRFGRGSKRAQFCPS